MNIKEDGALKVSLSMNLKMLIEAHLFVSIVESTSVWEGKRKVTRSHGMPDDVLVLIYFYRTGVNEPE